MESKDKTTVSPLFESNFKTIASHYDGILKIKEEIEKKKEFAEPNMLYLNRKFLEKQIELNIRIYDQTLEHIRVNFGDEAAEMVETVFRKGMTRDAASAQFGMDPAAMNRSFKEWLGSAEREVIKDSHILKGTHYGDQPRRNLQMPHPDFSKKTDAEWRKLFKERCKEVSAYESNLKRLTEDITLLETKLRGVSAVSTSDVRVENHNMNIDRFTLRLIERIDQKRAKIKEFDNEYRWIFEYIQRNPHPLMRILLPMVYTDNYRYDPLADMLECKAQSLRLILSTNLTKPI